MCNGLKIDYAACIVKPLVNSKAEVFFSAAFILRNFDFPSESCSDKMLQLYVDNDFRLR